jgi:hypothetical protein
MLNNNVRVLNLLDQEIMNIWVFISLYKGMMNVKKDKTQKSRGRIAGICGNSRFLRNSLAQSKTTKSRRKTSCGKDIETLREM